jgi:menaquinone reductase, iron-sulfur cluster-binding subunit
MKLPIASPHSGPDCAADSAPCASPCATTSCATAAATAPASAPPQSRRGVALSALGIAAGSVVASFSKRLFGAVETRHDEVLPGTSGRPVRWGMVIDLDKCTGCGACVTSCREENNVVVAGPENTQKDRAIFWMDMLRVNEGTFPEFHSQLIPTPCNHCENAPCAKVCPVGATYFNEEGIVAQMWARCIGCRFCTVACPYTRRYFNWDPPEFSDADKSRLNPDVSTRPVGVVEKCTLCHHRVRKVREAAHAAKRKITDAEVHTLPACAQSCPSNCITFGDMADPESAVSALAQSPRAFRLQEELGTRPKVVFLRRERW